ncbi:unnamed protein product [Brugia pahangi]|uniref:BPI2 domain-containing protein n=1 Tax=Brugia pahangi TaxID=6280 RepID=A0A0N4T224_BRUPA|nr:unnamed protein product [Brugia pahangi]
MSLNKALKNTFSKIQSDVSVKLYPVNFAVVTNMKLPGNDAVGYNIVVVMISSAVLDLDLSIYSDVAIVIGSATVDDTGCLAPSADSDIWC